MPSVPNFVGPTYDLPGKPASVQRTINMIPVSQEMGNERSPWVFKDAPGLSSFSIASAPLPVSMQWDSEYVEGPGGISNGGRTFSEGSDDTQTWTRSIGVIPAGQLAYWELQCNSVGDTDHTDQFLGIRGPAESVSTGLTLGATVVFRTQGANPGQAWLNYRGSTGATLAIATWGNGQVDSDDDRYYFAFDSAQGKLWFGRNSVGGWLAAGDPAADLNPIVTGIPAGPWHIFVGVDNDDGDNTCVLHTTPDSWLGTAPDGFTYVQGP